MFLTSCSISGEFNFFLKKNRAILSDTNSSGTIIFFFSKKFDCVNTLQDQLLENVKVDLVTPEGFTTRAVIPCQKLVYGEKDTTYVIVEFPPDVANSTGNVKF